MKTAISIPDAVFQRAEVVARRLGVSRSELYARAVEELLRRCEGESITAAMNEYCAREDSSLDPVFAALQFASLPREEW